MHGIVNALEDLGKEEHRRHEELFEKASYRIEPCLAMRPDVDPNLVFLHSVYLCLDVDDLYTRYLHICMDVSGIVVRNANTSQVQSGA